MSKTITASIPARKLYGKTYTAYIASLTQDDSGQWRYEPAGKISEAEAIDICNKASNWAAIRAEHFPMCGFHSDDLRDNTPSHKNDF